MLPLTQAIRQLNLEFRDEERRQTRSDTTDSATGCISQGPYNGIIVAWNRMF